jgi:uncharacterized membrane protein
MGHSLVLLLRVVHIVGAAFWLGGIMVLGLFLLPAARKVGTSGQEMLVEVMMRRKLAVYLPLAAVLTTLAGLALFWNNVSLSGGAWARSPMGKGMSFGAATAILAAIIGMGISSPAARKLVTSGASLSPEERARLAKRAGLGSQVALVLLLIAALAMSVARYL